MGERFQLISGHQRKRAAGKAGIEFVWCWVEEVDDATAYMLLATNNNQGQLDILEIGIHALTAVPTNEGGRGKKGGLREYAEKVGKDAGDVSRARQAAVVVETVGISQQFIGKAFHLAAIHKADERAWPILCRHLLKSHDKTGDSERGWSVADTAAKVEGVKKFDIPAKWEEVFLPYLAGEWPQQHALHVRPADALPGRLQLHARPRTPRRVRPGENVSEPVPAAVGALAA